MIRSIFLIFSIWMISVLSGCTKVTYDNPIDVNGTVYPTQGNPTWLADDDHDGIANRLDKDSEVYQRDTNAPVITVNFADGIRIAINDSTSIQIEKLKTMYTAVDVKDGNLTCTVTIKDLSYYLASTGSMTFTVIDSDSNTVSVSRTIVTYKPDAKDTKGPSLTFQLTNNDTTEVEFGATINYLENVFSWDYEENVEYTQKVTWTGTVNTSTAGVYPIVYTVKDASNNPTTKTRYYKVLKQEVISTRKPVITLKWPAGYKDKDTIRLVLPAQYVEPGYTAYDSTDGDITSKVTVTNPIQPGKTFSSYITYSVKNNAGVEAKEYRWVKITGGIDRIPPVITLKPEGFKSGDTTEVKVGTAWVDPGYTVTDNQDQNPKVTVNPTTISTASVTVLKITYSAMDADSNISQTVTRWVKVTNTLTNGDNTKPALSLKGNNPDTVFVGSKWIDPGYTVTDNKDPAPKVTVTPDLKDYTFTKDTTYKIVYTAKDSSGNDTSVTRTLRVKNIPTGSLLEKYDVENAKAFPASLTVSQFATQTTEGDGAPDLKSLSNLNISWSNSQLYYMGIQVTGIPNVNNIQQSSFTNTFNQPKPTVTVKSSGVTGFDGTYYVVIDGTTMVWVSSDGSFAIIWKK